MNFLDCFQVVDTIPVQEDQKLTYIIKGLLPFAIYGAAVACRDFVSGFWSAWSFEVAVRTLEMSN